MAKTLRCRYCSLRKVKPYRYLKTDSARKLDEVWKKRDPAYAYFFADLIIKDYEVEGEFLDRVKRVHESLKEDPDHLRYLRFRGDVRALWEETFPRDLSSEFYHTTPEIQQREDKLLAIYGKDEKYRKLLQDIKRKTDALGKGRKKGKKREKK